MPNFNNLVTERDKEILNTRRNILHDKEPKFDRQLLRAPKADLSHSAMEAEMDTCWGNYTWDVIDRPTDRKIVDSQWVCITKRAWKDQKEATTNYNTN
jgi:hypothetical protein